MAEYKTKIIQLKSDRALICRIKKAGIRTFHPKGRWNGYGYEQLPLVAEIQSLSDMRKFNKIVRELGQERQTAKPQRVRTHEEVITAWAKRLVKMYNQYLEENEISEDDEDKITLEEAIEIANSKLQAKDREIKKLEDRQDDRYSVKREKLINKKARENPLRWIKDSYHANCIVEAHIRHTDTCYDSILEDIHEKEEDGLLPRGYARDIARDAINTGDFSLIDDL